MIHKQSAIAAIQAISMPGGVKQIVIEVLNEQPEGNEIIVIGCGVCPFHSFYGTHERNHCGLSGATETDPAKPIFATCPIKTNSITIKLKEQ